jgi:hypothetical protein
MLHDVMGSSGQDFFASLFTSDAQQYRVCGASRFIAQIISQRKSAH